MFSTITIVTMTPFIFDVWDIEMLSDNRVHFRNRNIKITLGNTDKLIGGGFCIKSLKSGVARQKFIETNIETKIYSKIVSVGNYVNKV